MLKLVNFQNLEGKLRLECYSTPRFTFSSFEYLGLNLRQPKKNAGLLGPAFAERGGFEPPLRFRKHAFQACAFSHSATSPILFFMIVSQ